MPSKSVKQQHLAGMALAYKQGKMPHASEKVKQFAKASTSSLKDFAHGVEEALSGSGRTKAVEKYKFIYDKVVIAILDVLNTKGPEEAEMAAEAAKRAIEDALSEERIHEDMGCSTASMAGADMPIGMQKRIRESIFKALKEAEYDLQEPETEQIGAEIRDLIGQIAGQVTPSEKDATDDKKKVYDEFYNLLKFYELQSPEQVSQLDYEDLVKLRDEMINFKKVYGLNEDVQSVEDKDDEFAFGYKGDVMIVKSLPKTEARNIAIQVMSKFRKIKGLNKRDIDDNYILTLDFQPDSVSFEFDKKKKEDKKEKGEKKKEEK